jgi:hypothetical protein
MVEKKEQLKEPVDTSAEVAEAPPMEMPEAEAPEAVETKDSPDSELLEAEAESSPGVDAKEALAAVVKRFYPDADTATPESLMAALLPLVESIVAFHDDLNEVVEEFPEFGDFIIGLRNGLSPQEAIAMYFDPESLTPPEGAPDNEKVQMAKEERRKFLDEQKSKKAKIDENIQGSMKNIEALAKSRGWDEEKTMAFGDKIAGLFTDWADGQLNPESLEVLEKGFSFDETVAAKDSEKEAAVEDAKVAGRNEQIAKKRMTKETGDGLPKLTNTGSSDKKENKDKFTSGLERIANRKSIL